MSLFLVNEVTKKLEQIDTYDQANRQWRGIIQAEIAKHQKLEKAIKDTVSSRPTTEHGISERNIITDTANQTPGPSRPKQASSGNKDNSCTGRDCKVCHYKEVGRNFAAEIEEEIASCSKGQILTCRSNNVIYLLIFPCEATYGK